MPKPKSLPKDKPSSSTPADRCELRVALADVVSAELRFGMFTHVRPELDQRWDRILVMMETLFKQ